MGGRGTVGQGGGTLQCGLSGAVLECCCRWDMPVSDAFVPGLHGPRLLGDTSSTYAGGMRIWRAGEEAEP